jgi:hypothetical protein
MSYLEHIKLAPHYHALGMTEIMLEEDNAADYPWHLVANFTSPPHFYDRSVATCDLQFVGFDQGSGLTFVWLFDIDDLDSGEIDLKSCEHVISKLSAVPQQEFKDHIRRTIRNLHEMGTLLIEEGKQEQADAVSLSQLVQP